MIGGGSGPVGPLVAAAVGAPVGLVAGRLARWAADGDRARRHGTPPTSGWSIELTTALVLGALAGRAGIGPGVAPYVVVVTALMAVTVTDLRDHRIPDRVIGPAVVVLAACMVPSALALGQPERLAWAGSGALVFSGTLLAVHLARPRGLGRGDVKLAVVLGAALGWIGPPWPDTVLLVAWTLAGASALGLVVAMASTLRRSGRGERSWARTAVPFAPALSAATLAVVASADLLVR